jgi:hypothetical protein
MRTITFLFILLLAGCATTYQSPEEKQQSFDNMTTIIRTFQQQTIVNRPYTLGSPAPFQPIQQPITCRTVGNRTTCQ